MCLYNYGAKQKIRKGDLDTVHWQPLQKGTISILQKNIVWDWQPWPRGHWSCFDNVLVFIFFCNKLTVKPLTLLLAYNSILDTQLILNSK